MNISVGEAMSIQAFMGIPFGDGCEDLHRKPSGVPTISTAGIAQAASINVATQGVANV